MRTVINVQDLGHNGPFQFGFERRVRVVLDCGHSHTENWNKRTDTPNGNHIPSRHFAPGAQDNYPRIGDHRDRCPACGLEDQYSYWDFLTTPADRVRRAEFVAAVELHNRLRAQKDIAYTGYAAGLWD